MTRTLKDAFVIKSKLYPACFALAIVSACFLGAIQFANDSIGKGMREADVYRIVCFGCFFALPIASALSARVFAEIRIHRVTWFLLHVMAVEIYLLVAENDYSHDQYAVWIGGFVGAYLAVLLSGVALRMFSKPEISSPQQHSYSILAVLVWTAMIAVIISCELNYVHYVVQEVPAVLYHDGRLVEPKVVPSEGPFRAQRLMGAMMVATCYFGVVAVIVMPVTIWIRKNRPRPAATLVVAAVVCVCILAVCLAVSLPLNIRIYFSLSSIFVVAVVGLLDWMQEIAARPQ